MFKCLEKIIIICKLLPLENEVWERKYSTIIANVCIYKPNIFFNNTIKRKSSTHSSIKYYEEINTYLKSFFYSVCKLLKEGREC